MPLTGLTIKRVGFGREREKPRTTKCATGNGVVLSYYTRHSACTGGTEASPPRPCGYTPAARTLRSPAASLPLMHIFIPNTITKQHDVGAGI